MRRLRCTTMGPVMRSATLLRFFVISALLAPATAAQQAAPPGLESVYEGQKVSAISLIANPHRNLEPLVSVVTQKVGEPYSKTKVDESANALREKGGFDKVKVEIV